MSLDGQVAEETHGARRATNATRPPDDTRAQRGAARFTLDGDPGAETAIAAQLDALAHATEVALGDRLHALLLVGSYARGEGGVVLRDGRFGAFNDYDLILVVRGGTASVTSSAERIGHEWSERLGVEVTLWPIDRARLRDVPPTLFWLDIGLGGARLLRGDAATLSSLPRLRARDVPLDEAGRLLANRAAGLALSNLGGEYAAPDMMARHAHKAVLACGDVRLLAADRYLPSLCERLTELERLAPAPRVGEILVEAYRDALRYRARPDRWRPPRDAPLADWYAQLRERVTDWHLDFEAWRAGSPVECAAFARWRGRLFPRLPDVRTGGGIAAALRAALRGRAPLFPYLGHPRERLARVSAALAYGIADPAARSAAARLLGLHSDNASDERLRQKLVALVGCGG